jgi:acetyl esterase/lipase
MKPAIFEKGLQRAGLLAVLSVFLMAGQPALAGGDMHISPACARSLAELPAEGDGGEEGVWRIPPRILPPPAAASAALRKTIRESPQPRIADVLAMTPRSAEAWMRLREAMDAPVGKNAPRLAEAMGVRMTPGEIAGVRVYRLVPKKVAAAHEGHLFVHVHGGAYVFNAGLAGQIEAIVLAARAGIPVISIDYRMPPDHPFPAALEDVTAVWKALLKERAPERMAMGGTSAGAGLTLAALMHFRDSGLPLPAAVFAGTPWADLTQTGDSFFINEGIDRTLVTWKGVLEGAGRLYAGGRDLREPLLSPLYGDFSGLPPTLLVTGTRDLFLSLTARVHRRLRDAGVPAEIHVFEGLSHGEYIALRDTPESQAVYREIAAFLRQHLR